MVRRILDIINNFKNPESLINEKEESSHMKTKMLGLTVYKISLLLRRGFGEIGIKIIEDKVSMSDDEDDSLLPGKKKYATFLLVRITQFNQITDILQEEIIVFVNKIVRILHESVKKWDGIANKNYGDKYLITWLLSEDYYHNITEMTKKLERKAKRAEEKLLGVDQNEIEQAIKLNEMAKENSDDSENETKKKKKKKGKKNKKEEEEKKKREEEQRQKELEEQKKREEEENKIFIDESIQEKADRTLVTAIKVISEIKRASDLAAYASHPKLGPKFNNFRAKISCVMHVGWLIEGPVGSNFKIDALYLSPAITVCTKLQYLCEEVYDCSIMMTEDFKNCLSPTSLILKFTRPPPEEEPDSEPIKVSSQSLRIVDRVFMKCKGIPMDLYSFDIQIPEVDVVAPENHQLGDLIVNPEIEEYEDIEKVKKFPLSYMFCVDEDVYTLQKHRFGNDFYVEYNEALEAYIDGEWEYAIESIDKCLLIDPNDGPCKEMRRFMKDENNSKIPKKWMGYRTFLFEEQSAQPFGESEGSAQFQDEEEDEEASESDP